MYLDQVWLPTGTTYNLHPKSYNTVFMYFFNLHQEPTESFQNYNNLVCSVCVNRQISYSLLFSPLVSSWWVSPSTKQKRISKLYSTASKQKCSWHVLYKRGFVKMKSNVALCSCMHIHGRQNGLILQLNGAETIAMSYPWKVEGLWIQIQI